MRILALDWGTVRVGAAVSDLSGTIATPMQEAYETKTALSEIPKTVTDLQVEKILVGMPKNLSGAQTGSSEQVARFIEQLQAKITCPIETLDERFSSIGAIKTLSAQGVSYKNQRGQVDNLAAAQLLQSYLDKK